MYVAIYGSGIIFSISRQAMSVKWWIHYNLSLEHFCYFTLFDSFFFIKAADCKQGLHKLLVQCPSLAIEPMLSQMISVAIMLSHPRRASQGPTIEPGKGVKSTEFPPWSGFSWNSTPIPEDNETLYSYIRRTLPFKNLS